MLAALARSVRNSIVGGQRWAVQISGAARVRREVRGQTFSNYVRSASRACQWYVSAEYAYVREENFNAQSWIRATGQRPHETSASVDCFVATPSVRDAPGVRSAKRGESRECASLINGVHRGLDLFRPYTASFLQSRLDDQAWGAKPDWWPRVYGWEDYYVVEERGRIVACAGLWERGRHVREVCRNLKTGEQETKEFGALLDFGWAPGREDAMARLIRHLLGVTARLGRSRLMAPIEHWPRLRDLLSDIPSTPDRRVVLWWSYMPGRDGRSIVLRKPDTDLVYW